MTHFLARTCCACTAIIMFLFSLGCETKEDNALAKAQQCLDQGSVSRANECRSMVASLKGVDAAIIRCSADFLEQGFTTNRLASAFLALNETTSTTDPMLGLMGFLVFTTSERAERAFTDCSETGLPGFTMFGSMAKMATIVASAVPSGISSALVNGRISQEEMQTALQTLDSANDSDLGSVVVNLQSSYCGGSSNNQYNQVCGQLANAIGSTTDLATIGAQLRSTLLNPSD